MKKVLNEKENCIKLFPASTKLKISKTRMSEEEIKNVLLEALRKLEINIEEKETRDFAITLRNQLIKKIENGKITTDEYFEIRKYLAIKFNNSYIMNHSNLMLEIITGDMEDINKWNEHVVKGLNIKDTNEFGTREYSFIVLTNIYRSFNDTIEIIKRELYEHPIYDAEVLNELLKNEKLLKLIEDTNIRKNGFLKDNDMYRECYEYLINNSIMLFKKDILRLFNKLSMKEEKRREELITQHKVYSCYHEKKRNN